MRKRALLFFLLCVSCGLAKPALHANEHSAGRIQDVSVPKVIRNDVPNVGVAELAQTPRASLEYPSALVRYFEKLKKLEAATYGADVVMVQFGDSHTAADMMTAPLRKSLQARFDDGGRGFVPIGYPWKFFRQEGVSGGMSGFTTQRTLHKKNGEGDGLFGISGVAIASNRRNAVAWTDIRSQADSAEIAFLEQPEGGAFDVLVDNAVQVRVRTRSKKISAGYIRVEIPAGSEHRIEVRTTSSDNVRIFGMRLERKQKGVEVDALGINGARMLDALRWDPRLFETEVRHRNPDLVILAYGTNESVDDTPVETHQRALVDLLGRIARAQPAAACLVMGPPDHAAKIVEGQRVTSERLLQIVRMEQAVAEAAGCAFFDTLGAMGGVGSMQRWVESEEPQLGQRDYVHLTGAGYEKIGKQMAAELLAAYDRYKSTKSGLDVSFRSSSVLSNVAR